LIVSDIITVPIFYSTCTAKVPICAKICIPLLDDLKLLLIEMSRLEGIGAFAWRYLYMRAWCSSSIHWEGVKGLLVLDSRKACSFGLPRSKPR